MDIANRIAIIRFKYHANALSINNVLNQLHIISDNTAESRNKNHTMIVFNDILPRLGYDISNMKNNKE